MVYFIAKTGQEEQVWSRWEMEWNTWLQANKQAHGSTHTFFKVTKEQIGERMHTGVINWYTEARVNLLSAL